MATISSRSAHDSTAHVPPQDVPLPPAGDASLTEHDDLLNEALALVGRVNEQVRKSAEESGLYPKVQRVA